MKKIYKPILFSTEMVQAILAGRKTQIRRSVKANPGTCIFCGCTDNDCSQCIEKTGSACYWIDEQEIICSACSDISISKAKYEIGDVLFVRETLHQNSELGLEYKADNTSISEHLIPEDFKVRLDKNGNYSFCDIPNIFMLKCFARIFLEVTNVRCERLKDISTADAIAEGIEVVFEKATFRKEPVYKDYLIKSGIGTLSAVSSFFSLWRSINGKDSLTANPWVWVYEFKEIEKPAVWPQ